MGSSILHIILFHILVVLFIVHSPVLSKEVSNQEILDIPEGRPCTTTNGGNGVCMKAQDCWPCGRDRRNGQNAATEWTRCGYIDSTEVLCCPADGKIVDIVVCQGLVCSSKNNNRPLRRVIIAHGIEAKENEFPFFAALGYLNRNRGPGEPQFEYFCGGSLISPRHVLTAAHCKKNKNNEAPHHVLLGAIDLLNSGANVQRIQIAQIVPHPEYKSHLNYNDVALLILKSNAVINSHVQVIRMHTMSLKSTSTAGKKFQAIGIGVTEKDELSTTLLKTHDLRIVPKAECEQWYPINTRQLRYGLDDKQICARDVNTSRNSDTCTGDSGGPLIMTATLGYQPPLVVGLTSFGQDCGYLSPGVYAAIYPYLNWINRVLRMS